MVTDWHRRAPKATSAASQAEDSRARVCGSSVASASMSGASTFHTGSPVTSESTSSTLSAPVPAHTADQRPAVRTSRWASSDSTAAAGTRTTATTRTPIVAMPPMS